jgi:hypothetical protein
MPASSGCGQATTFLIGEYADEELCDNPIFTVADGLFWLRQTAERACNLKADEIDPEWELGSFVADLARGWIQARQAAGADRTETAKVLLSWMDRDNYGFFNDLGADAIKVLDRAGLAAFEIAVQERFKAACGERKKQAGNSFRDQWGQIPLSIYAQQRSVEKYLDLTALTGLTRGNCVTIATILQAKRKLNDALAWIERGLEMKDSESFPVGAGYNLAGTRRALLSKLGRGREALDSAWAEFQARPSKITYEELLHYVPKSERGSWHEMAIAAAERGDLVSLIELWIAVKETERLAERLARAGDRELEEPAIL